MRWDFAFFSAAALLCGCAGPKSSPSPCPCSVPRDAAALAGQHAAEKLESRLGGVESSAADERRMRKIAARLRADEHVLTRGMSCRVLATREFNAYSLPGPRLYITRGLLDRLDCDELLAAAIAHEMAHLLSGDSLRPAPERPADALDRELRADEIGRTILAGAGIGESAMLRLLEIIAPVQPQAWASARIAAARTD